MTAEPAVSVRLLPVAFDMLLYWRVHGLSAPREAVTVLLEWVGSAPRGPRDLPDSSLLREAAFRLTGSQLLSRADALEEPRPPSVRDLARAVVAGACTEGVAPSSPACARACCLMLDRCEYVAAYQWLTVLVGRGSGRSTQFEAEISRFVGQARDYLGSMTSLLRSDRMTWEGLLFSSHEGRRKDPT